MSRDDQGFTRLDGDEQDLASELLRAGRADAMPAASRQRVIAAVSASATAAGVVGLGAAQMATAKGAGAVAGKLGLLGAWATKGVGLCLLGGAVTWTAVELAPRMSPAGVAAVVQPTAQAPRARAAGGAMKQSSAVATPPASAEAPSDPLAEGHEEARAIPQQAPPLPPARPPVVGDRGRSGSPAPRVEPVASEVANVAPGSSRHADAPRVSARADVVQAPTAPATGVASAARSAGEASANQATTAPASAAASGDVAMAAPAPATTAALSREVAPLVEARRALRGGDPARALALLDGHARAFPTAVLGPEAFVIRVEALLALGRRAEATALADSWLARDPASPFAKRLRALVGR